MRCRYYSNKSLEGHVVVPSGIQTWWTGLRPLSDRHSWNKGIWYRLNNWNLFRAWASYNSSDGLVMGIIRPALCRHEIIDGEPNKDGKLGMILQLERYQTYCSSSCRHSGFILARSGFALRFVWVNGFSTIRNSSSSWVTSKLAFFTCKGWIRCGLDEPYYSRRE